ncbi:MAG TPA: MATE family efflux transporter, partial [Saprospiraceae bacterium]|nr:MATE family efflux transporter [Saprospiraceae bacterium]
TGINTLVSNLIGQGRRHDVLAAAWKTGKLCLLTTMMVAIPVLFYPEQLLYPLLGKSDMSLISETRPVFYLLLGLLTMSTFGTILVNALSGTGATLFSLRLQAICIAIYLAYIYYVTNFTQADLVWVWAAEVLYWMLMIVLSFAYLRTERWHALEV